MDIQKLIYVNSIVCIDYTIMNGNIFVVETVLNVTVHYQYFTSSACRDYHKKIVYFALLLFLPCRDVVFVTFCF